MVVKIYYKIKQIQLIFENNYNFGINLDIPEDKFTLLIVYEGSCFE